MPSIRSPFIRRLGHLAFGPLLALAACSAGTEDPPVESDEGALAAGVPATPKHSSVFGTITRDGVRAVGLVLHIGCPSLESDLGGEARTDETGGYAALVRSPAYGRCTAEVGDGALHSEPFAFFVSPSALRTDLAFDAKLKKLP